MGVVVTIVDDSDRVGFLTAALCRTGELYMTSVVDMVANVLTFLARYVPEPPPNSVLVHAMSHGRVPMPATPAPGTTNMSKLNIIDHGNPNGLQIGTDWVSTASFASFQPEFARLAQKFETDACVHLQHCEAGMNLRLMEMFADTFGVPVISGRGMTNFAYRVNTGNYVRVHPARDGSRTANDTFFWGPSAQ